MTLDEARHCLGVSSGVSADDIREAFRRKARDIHPDRHPHADAASRTQLARDFDRAREARDILVRYTLDPLRKPPPEKQEPKDERRRESTYSHAHAGTGERTERARAPGAASSATTDSESDTRGPAPRVTMRFDEFVAWTDAAGFDAGHRTRPWVDWPRIIAWSSVGVVILGLVIGAAVMASLGTTVIAPAAIAPAPAAPVPIAFEQSFVTEDAAYAAPECGAGCWVWDVTPAVSCPNATATIALYEMAAAVEPSAFHDQYIGPMDGGAVTRLVVPTEPGMPPQAAIFGISCTG
jgi:hypothetical protein